MPCLKFLRRKKIVQPPETPHPQTKQARVAHTLPSNPSTHFPQFMGNTVETPNISHLYRHDTATTWTLRQAAQAYSCQAKRREKTTCRRYGFPPLDPRPKRATAVIRVPGRVFMKYGTDVQLSEATTLQFVAQKTTIPVPNVYCAFQHDRMNFILMEFVEGDSIWEIWEKLSSAVRKQLMSQIKEHFKQLRAIPHPRPALICSSSLGPLFDRRMDDDPRGFGPFANENDFNNFLRCGTQDPSQLNGVSQRFHDNEVSSDLTRMINFHRDKRHKICFTHGDAHCGNILVKQGQVVAWIDFEMAGFFPEHWEYTTAMTTGNKIDFDDRWWTEELKKVLVEYPEELEIEIIRQRLLDAFMRSKIPRSSLR